MDECDFWKKIALTTLQKALGFALCNLLLPCNVFPNRSLVYVITYTNRCSITDSLSRSFGTPRDMVPGVLNHRGFGVADLVHLEDLILLQLVKF